MLVIALTAIVTAWSAFEAFEEAEELASLADYQMEGALRAGDNSDDYTLTSVMFATVLLFAALSSKTSGRRLQVVLLSAACVLLVLSVGVLATFPATI